MTNYKELFIATTDTVTGIGAPVSEENRQAINLLKGSPQEKPLVIMVESIEKAKELYADKGFNKKAQELAADVWPGAITLVLSDTLALRIPNNDELRAFIAAKGPIYMTSANVTGEKPLSFYEAKETFEDIEQYYDFGSKEHKPSRIIDVRTDKVLRK